ncbi:MAG: M28 family metallopeptidase [Bacteroidota bacterium]|nr:M28 family metallopeptidase [Bacteroidota bacterium]
MKHYFILALMFLATAVKGQEKPSAGLKPEKARGIVDTGIAAMVKEVSADSIKSYILHLASFETRHSLSDTTRSDRGIGAARRWVAEKFRQFARRNNADMQAILDPFTVAPNPRIPRVPYTVTMKNTLGILKGQDPADDRVLLVTGHLDSRNSDVMDSVGIAPGANDDASGVALVLELARVMSAKKFPCTIIFMAVQGEEQGLLGARHMAGRMRDEGRNLVAVFNNDIVGNSIASETGERNDRTVRVFSEMIPAKETDDQAAARAALKSENDSPSRQLARYIKESAEIYLRGFTATLNARPDRFLRGGDHLPFSQEGFTAVRLTEYHENFLHQHQNVRKENNVQYGDLPEFVDFEYAANVARLNLAAMSSLAKAPAAPRDVTMKVNLGNLTYLTWSPPAKGPRVKGYYVLMRETIQPFWETKFFVKDTTVTLPYSKDNYFFAVQAVGEDEHVSLPVVPVPIRN